MAEQQLVPDLSFVSLADLQTKQYYLVGLNSNGKLILCDGSTEAIALGPLQDKPRADAAGAVRQYGLSKVILGGNVTVGARVKPDSAGKAIATTTNKDWYVGIITVAGSTGETGEMLCKQGYISA